MRTNGCDGSRRLWNGAVRSKRSHGLQRRIKCWKQEEKGWEQEKKWLGSCHRASLGHILSYLWVCEKKRRLCLASLPLFLIQALHSPGQNTKHQSRVITRKVIGAARIQAHICLIMQPVIWLGPIHGAEYTHHSLPILFCHLWPLLPWSHYWTEYPCSLSSGLMTCPGNSPLTSPPPSLIQPRAETSRSWQLVFTRSVLTRR